MSNIKNLAIAEADYQGADRNIVLATIEAETGFRNILGDNGNALGPGQVWPKWHMDAFRYAADKYRHTLPSELAGLQKLTLSDDAFAVCVTVYVIKRVWNGSGHDFRQFSLSYVGPAIPDSDYTRRYNIWLKYQGGGNTLASFQPGSTFAGGTSQTSSSQFSGVTIPASNYGVVANSQRFGNVLYGRRYRVIVSNANGAALDVSQLRCTFKIQKTILQQPNYSEIAIYNLSPDTENSLIREGNRIIIEAGYEGEQYGLIFDGDVIQPIRDKEDGVTYRLTLYALDGDRFSTQGFVGFSMVKGQTSRSVVENIVSQAQIPSQLGSISDGFTNSELTRGKVVFGLAKDYLRQLAQTQEASFYVEDGKVNIVRATDLPEGEIFDLSPASGLIGVPAQSEHGVTFKCLLNPRIKINSLVHIDNTLIREQVYQQGQVVRGLDNDGVYRVIGITYKGDTRGDDWECECQCVSQAGLMPSMMSTATGNPW
ncbi:phage protein [Paenibacillus sp. GCM10012303]|uniref:phage protein n=1 Tax=Paenibacillus sp. GCM10012303 TaxID=3317340 RepID=UPI0036233F38